MKIIIILLLSASAAFAGDTLRIAEGYPVWLKDGETQTDQTSGIYQLDGSEQGNSFLYCDDIGYIGVLAVTVHNGYQRIYINKIDDIPVLNNFFKDFHKADFEEIVLDTVSHKIYLSVEGNGANTKEEVGIYQLDAKDHSSISKIKFDEKVYEFIAPNIGFEGLAVTEHKMFLGLENILAEDNKFSNRTVMYVIDRNTNELTASVFTDTLNISTICGLYAVTDYELYGIDRNAKSMFYINFNTDYSVRYIDHFPLELSIPGHPEINKILGTSIESITLDDEGNIYAVVDPWKEFYMPDNEDAKKLSEEELENFRNYVPILYKFLNPIK